MRYIRVGGEIRCSLAAARSKAVTEETINGPASFLQMILVMAAVCLIMVLGGCGDDPLSSGGTKDPCSDFGDDCIDVLLIGNSLTAYHNTPDIIQKLADSAGVEMNVQIAIYLGHSLEMIVERTDVFERIRRERWDYVMIQGSNYLIAFPEHHDAILPPVQTLADSIYDNEACTAIVFFMDWAPPDGVELTTGEKLDFHEFQAMIRYGTLVFAETHGFAVAPCGMAWDVVLREHPDIVLHDEDGGHPGPRGAYINACVYYSTFTGLSSEGLGVNGGLVPAEVGLFQAVASSTVLDSLDLWMNE